MERKHIAVFTPLAAGHVYPALGLCSELISRGHRVTYPTNERFASKIREVGAEALEFRVPEIRHADQVSQFQSSDISTYWRAFTSIYAPLLLATAAATVADFQRFYAKNPPDVILYEWFSFAGRILASQLHCPAIQICSHFAHRDSLLRIDGASCTPEPMLSFGKLLDSFMSTYGFAQAGHLWHIEELNIFFIPNEFQYDVDLFDDRFKFVGATHNRKPSAALWTNQNAGEAPLLLISENTASADDRFLRLCIDAFADSQYNVVFSKGFNSPDVPSSLLPRNFEINLTAFNRDILPLTDVLLCQGGMGTTLESMYHGVPVVAMPSDPFNSEVAHRLAELRLGLCVTDVTSSTVRQAVDAVFSDEAMHGRVSRMQESLKRSPGPQAAATMVEEFISSARRRVVPST